LYVWEVKPPADEVAAWIGDRRHGTEVAAWIGDRRHGNEVDLAAHRKQACYSAELVCTDMSAASIRSGSIAHATGGPSHSSQPVP
jgi:hypothetical protein